MWASWQTDGAFGAAMASSDFWVKSEPHHKSEITQAEPSQVCLVMGLAAVVNSARITLMYHPPPHPTPTIPPADINLLTPAKPFAEILWHKLIRSYSNEVQGVFTVTWIQSVILKHPSASCVSSLVFLSFTEWLMERFFAVHNANSKHCFTTSFLLEEGCQKARFGGCVQCATWWLVWAQMTGCLNDIYITEFLNTSKMPFQQQERN